MTAAPSSRAPHETLVGSVEPTRRTGDRQRAGRGDETRERIVREAARCVLDEGFSGASASRIAQRCGVTWGVIQYHFGDRAGLLSAVVAAGYDEYRAIIGAAAPPDGSVHDRVRAIVDVGWAAFSTPLGQASIEILVNTRASRSHDPDHARHLVDMARGLHELLDDAFPAIGSRSSSTLRNVVWATLRGFVLARMMSPTEFRFEREREVLVDLVASYLADPAPAAGSPAATDPSVH